MTEVATAIDDSPTATVEVQGLELVRELRRLHKRFDGPLDDYYSQRLGKLTSSVLDIAAPVKLSRNLLTCFERACDEATTASQHVDHLLSEIETITRFHQEASEDRMD